MGGADQEPLGGEGLKGRRLNVFLAISLLLYTLGLLSLIFWARMRNIWARKVAAEMASQGGG
jgi:hypothetical protein